jgi:hypothetical protein
LLYTDKKKAAKTTGCLESANQALRKADEDALSAGEKKFIRAYENASRAYLKHKTLIKHRNKNPSWEHFIAQLDAVQSRIAANQLAASQESGDVASEGDTETSEDTDGDEPK